MKLLAYLALVRAADESYTNTLASCNTFASKFKNTCTVASAFASIPTESVTC